MITTDDVWKKALNPTDIRNRTAPLLEEQTRISKAIAATFPSAPNDPVNHPAHYNHYQGLEIIDLTEQMNFCKGNAVKYIARAGIKNPDTEVEDLKKAVWYLNREIDRIENRP